jgi:hypothetical protein
VLEPEDSFAQEVAMLGQSETFMAALLERAQEQGGISLGTRKMVSVPAMDVRIGAVRAPLVGAHEGRPYKAIGSIACDGTIRNLRVP